MLIDRQRAPGASPERSRPLMSRGAEASPDRKSARAALIRAAIAMGNVQRRLLTLTLRALGPKRAYALMAHLARRFYRLADHVRQLSESRCRAALGNERTESEIQAIAEQAFVHRMWNLVDLMLAPRLLRPDTHGRYGGQIPEPYRDFLISAQQRRRPVILLTAYCGPYDLLPVFLGLDGIQATAVYRPHPNRDFDRYRHAVRTIAGCGMLTQAGAAWGVSETLETGGTVALLSDHAGGPKGVPVCFLGERTMVPRTVGLLAERYDAAIAVTAIRRGSQAFQFELVVSDLFGPDDWRGESDRIAYITHRYCAALERVICEAPEQYLWLHRREPGAQNGKGAQTQANTTFGGRAG